MKYIIKDIKMPLDYDERTAIAEIKNKYFKNDDCEISIFKKSLDARNKDNIIQVFSFAAKNLSEKSAKALRKYKNITALEDFQPLDTKYPRDKKPKKPKKKPIIIGAGPAGLFCAYFLAEYGFEPIIIERGERVEEREKTVNQFIHTKSFNPSSNIQFGEGGAGTFSDGKLTTRINDPLSETVIDIFSEMSGLEQIKYASKPHIGTDYLIKTVKNLREKIIEMGGVFHFSKTLTDINIVNGKIRDITLDNGENMETDTLILATGHSARDIYRLLQRKNVSMRAKPFSVGARIEHFRDYIEEIQYGKFKGHKNLPSAEYKLWHKLDSGHTAYTFCMCPGGLVMAAQSENDTIVVNGMSELARDKKNSNSAVCVSVSPEDFGNNLFSGLEFIEKLEKNAFLAAGKNLSAPFTTANDLCEIKNSLNKSLPEPSYPFGVRELDFKEIFPEFIVNSMAEGLRKFDRQIKGFAQNGILTGVETRTSSPIRILRKENMESENITGLYPCGEGAGYAGGIVSSAVDGIRVAMELGTN